MVFGSLLWVALGVALGEALRVGEGLATVDFLRVAGAFFSAATFFAVLVLADLFFGEVLFTLVVGMGRFVLGIG